MTAEQERLTRRGVSVGALTVAGLAAAPRPTDAQPAVSSGAGHVVLLGDSVLDNAGYLRGGAADVTAQLRAGLPSGWRATRLARGGSVAADLPSQLGRLPPDATHLVISAGGNDAGRREGVLGEPARSVAEGLARVAALRDAFARDYRPMLGMALGRGLPVAVCTVYDPRFPEPWRRQVTVVALAAFNDVITREAFARGAALLDLRLVCNQDDDFAGATGPSVQGGGKIAATIADWAAGRGRVQHRSEVFAGTGRSH